jgi:3-hydroxymyristoyl/3-hydroxydecanoyl-(acyl carrier protein) dehydratase
MSSSVTAEPIVVPPVIDLDKTFIPVGRMRQISRLVSLQGSTIAGEMELGAGHWVWPEHFPGDPIFPGTLLIEGAGQLVALWAWAQGRRGRPRLVRTSAEFLNPVGPGADRIQLSAAVRQKRHLYIGNVEIICAGIPVARIEALLAVLAST